MIEQTEESATELLAQCPHEIAESAAERRFAGALAREPLPAGPRSFWPNGSTGDGTTQGEAHDS